MADIFTIKDANGKEFSVDMAKIADINGDRMPETAVQDSIRHKLAFSHNTMYRNAKGDDIDVNQLLSDIKSGRVKIAAVDVDFEATHSGKNHNYCIYYSDSMEKDAESFTNPFSKPLLKNHDSYSEPIGRIRKAEHGDSSLTDERTAIHATARVTDEDAMIKFIDGRYRTVSIGGTMGTVTCNICGKTILKDGRFKFCGHWRGETYKDQVCYWGARDIDYNELSVVNSPADDYAQVMSVTVLTDEDVKRRTGQNDNKEDSEMGDTNSTPNNTNNDELKTKVFDFIDNLLGGNQNPAAPGTNAADSADNNTQDNNTQGKNTTDSADTQTDNNQQPENTPATADSTVADTVKAELDEAKQKLQESTDKVNALESDIAAKDEEIKNLKQQIEDSKTEANNMKDQMIEIAKQNKSLVSDAIIMNEIAQGKLVKDKAEDRKNELADKSMKELGAILDSITKTNIPRQQAHVDNPTLATDTNNNANKSETNTQDSKKKEKSKTVNDFASSIIDKLPV
jgi:hypothetical protein